MIDWYFPNVSLGPFYMGASILRDPLAQRGIPPLIPAEQADNRSVSAY